MLWLFHLQTLRCSFSQDPSVALEEGRTGTGAFRERVTVRPMPEAPGSSPAGELEASEEGKRKPWREGGPVEPRACPPLPDPLPR